MREKIYLSSKDIRKNSITKPISHTGSCKSHLNLRENLMKLTEIKYGQEDTFTTHL